MKFCYPVYDPMGDLFGVHREHHWPCEFTTDLAVALAQPFRVASVPIFFDHAHHWPGPNLPKIPIDLSKFDLVLFHEAENRPWPDVKQWLNSTGVEKYVLVINNLDSSRQLPNQHVLFEPHWLMTAARQNQHVPPNQIVRKPFVFEAMLGARRAHRDYIMLAMTHSGLRDRSVVNYRDFPGGYTDVHTEEYQNIFPNTKLDFPYISNNYDPSWEPVDNIASHTINFPVPQGVYARTDYSIVAETNYTGPVFFPTEKSAKVLLSQRVCIWFAPQNFLQNLRNMGFETFDDVIDESYDSDDYGRDWKRFERAWHAAEQLARFEDPVLVYEKLLPRLQHNRDLMLRLRQSTIDQWQQIMLELIPSQHWSL